MALVWNRSQHSRTIRSFKYAGFLLQIGNPLLGLIGIPAATPDIHLPIGISFFTFKAISYLVDVHRKDLPAERDPLISALTWRCSRRYWQGLSPAWSIPRARCAAARSRSPDSARGPSASSSKHRRNYTIANAVAAPANAAFSTSIVELSAPLAWLGALCYTIQIYFDFAGYTNMAIGLGHMMGFNFPRNFNYPYAARSVTEFWQRWHITLSTWLRDYLWYPLGANRGADSGPPPNLLLVFGLCGLWHGANYTFIVWVFFHGSLMALERAGLLWLLSRIWRPFRTAYTVLMVMIGWVFFRAGSLDYAFGYLGSIAGGNTVQTDEDPSTAFAN